MVKLEAERVLRHIRAINSAQTSSESLAAISTAAKEYGFEHLIVGQLVNPLNVVPKDILFQSTMPRELTLRRLDAMKLIHDPVLKAALRTRRPFRWEAATRNASSNQKRMMEMMRDYGINDGYMFPMHSLDSVTGGISLAREASCSLDASEVAELELICSAAYYKFESLEGPFPYQMMPKLTDREVEVLQLSAAGRTNVDIAILLGIKEATVKMHVKNARERLGALNRTHAVATAIASSQIIA